MYAEDIMDGGGGGGGWEDYADYSGGGGDWGGGWGDYSDFSSGGVTDWGDGGFTTDLTDGGLGSDDSFNSSPTAFAEQTGIDTNYIRDYYQSQFDGSSDSPDPADGNNSLTITDPDAFFGPDDGSLPIAQFDGGAISVPVNPGDTQWDVTVRSLNAFADAAGLPADEKQKFVDYWSDNLRQANQTGLYHYGPDGRTQFTEEEFAELQRNGEFNSELTPDKQPLIVEDLRQRQENLGLGEPVFRISTTAYGNDNPATANPGSNDPFLSNPFSAPGSFFNQDPFATGNVNLPDYSNVSNPGTATSTAADQTPAPDMAGRFGQVIERALPKLPENIRQDVAALVSPESLATMGGIAAVWGASHFFGVGEVADVVLLAAGGIMLGSEAFNIAGDLKDFITLTANATTQADLDQAASHLASAVSRLGVDTVAALLTHKAVGGIRGELPVAPVAEVPGATTALPTRGAYFFGDNVLPYIDNPNATLGRPGSAHFFMPLEDAAGINNVGDAARYSGMADSITRAYVNQTPGYGVSFPTDGLQIRLPTAADANGWAHFLEGGHTAVRTVDPNGGFLLNNVREFVTPGGARMPPGSVLFQLGPNGTWIPLRRFP